MPIDPRRVRLVKGGPSNGAVALADEMGIRILRNNGTRNTPGPFSVIVNWGVGTEALLQNYFDSADRVLNSKESVMRSSNKLLAFQSMERGGVRTVPFTTEVDVAREWLANGRKVVSRKLLRSSCARGMEITGPGESLPAAPLYTRYVPKLSEYRVHVIGDRLFVQMKMCRSGCMPADYRVRNLENGWVFCRNGFVIPKAGMLEKLCRDAISAVRLDFGAVDVIWNQRDSVYYVLEINTAPGLEGSSVNEYSEGLWRMINA